MVAAGFLEYERELARLRQNALAGTQHSDLPEDLPEDVRVDSRDKAGGRMGVSGKTLISALQEEHRADFGHTGWQPVQELESDGESLRPRLLEELPECRGYSAL